MQTFLHNTDLEIIEEFVDFGNEGILHNFGRLSGVYDYDKASISYTLIGKVLRSVLPVNLMGHMLCYLVRRNSRNIKGKEIVQ